MSMFSLTDETIEEMKKNAGDIPGLDAWQKATESWIALMPEPMRAQAEAMANPLAAASAMSALGFATASQMMGLFMNNMNTFMELAEKEDLSSFELGLAPGLYYFISPRFMIDASIGGIGYESEKSTVKEPGAGSRQDNRFYTFLSSGIGLRLGVNLFFHPAGD